MADDRDTLAIIGEEIGLAFSPLKSMIETPEAFQSFMKQLGWDITGPVAPIQNLIGVVDPVITILEEGDITMGNIQNLLSAIKNLITAIEALTSQANAAFSNITATADEFKADFPLQLPQYLIVEYLLRQHAKVGSVLQLVGLIRITNIAATATRPAYFRKEVRFDAVGLLFSNPLQLLQTAYGWGTANINKEELFEKLTTALSAYAIPFRLQQLEDQVMAVVSNIPVTPATDKAALQLVIIDETTSDLAIGAGIRFLILPPAGGLLPGLAIMPYASAEFKEDIALTDTLSFKFDTALNFDNGIAIVLRPGQLPQLISNITVGGGTIGGIDAKIALGLKYGKRDGSKIVVFGNPVASRYEFESATIAAAAKLNRTGSKDVAIEFDLTGSKIVIKPAPGDADGFLGKLLPADGITLQFELGFGFGIQSGFYFKGSSGLEINLPAHLQLGPVEINNTTLGIKPNAQEIPIAIGVGIKAALGPIVAVVDGIGLIGSFKFPADRKGNLGPVNFGLGFKPPTGVGLSIDAGIVKGGGFLSLRPDIGEYSGALELSIQDTIQVAAIGIINTKMPDGSEGFSLLIIISAQFTPGIALSMGFFLSGLGGMLGINRTFNVPALREGVRNNALDSILFPEDVVANINTLLPQIKQIFPIQRDQFFIGLMAKITWGVPTLVSIEFGIAVEFTNPVRIAILGILKVVLPTEDAAVLRLQVNFLGIIDFDNGYLSFDASIVNSRILTFTLEGDMALRLNWGRTKGFLMSVGGFHPSFTPPAELNVPSLKRLTLTIFSGNPNLVLTCYFAVTSNTVQFGARIDLRFEVASFSVVGYLLFDVLFQFSPFHFEAHIGAGLAVKCGSSTLFSIDLDFVLAGPTPWNAKGTASFSILFITIKVRFNITWGDAQQISEPSIAVLPKALEAFNLAANWVAEIPINRTNLVSLKDLKATADEIILQSYGALKVSQTIVPLNMDINKFGNNVPLDVKGFHITGFSVGGQPLAMRDVRDAFAPASFLKMDDEDKLKAPSYAQEVSGVKGADSELLHAVYGVNRQLAYDCTISDFDPFPNKLPDFVPFNMAIFKLLSGGGDIAKNALSKQYKAKTFKKDGAVSIGEETFVIVNNSTLTQHAADAFSGGSQAEAVSALNAILATNPELKNNISVTPAYHLETA